MFLKIDVTQADIDAGQPKSMRECPIALACKRASQRSDVYVGDVSLQLVDHFGHLPEIAQHFVEDFDDSAAYAIKLEPFSFEIELLPIRQ